MREEKGGQLAKKRKMPPSSKTQNHAFLLLFD